MKRKPERERFVTCRECRVALWKRLRVEFRALIDSGAPLDDCLDDAERELMDVAIKHTLMNLRQYAMEHTNGADE